MAAQRSLDALREEVLVKTSGAVEECKLSTESGSEEAKEYAKSLHEVQTQNLAGLESSFSSKMVDLELKFEEATKKQMRQC